LSCSPNSRVPVFHSRLELCPYTNSMACLKNIVAKICCGQDTELTSDDVSSVQASWEVVGSAFTPEDVGVLFYKRLFTIAPEALQLFSFKDEPDVMESEKLRVQGGKTVRAVGTAVTGLNDLDKTVPKLQVLGKIHAGLGVQPKHFDIVGQALLDTLEAGLGDKWNGKLKGSWTKVYKMVAKVMCDAMLEEQKKRAALN